MMQLLLIMLQALEVNVYRFENGSVEVWYRLPISVLRDAVAMDISKDSVEADYSYWSRSTMRIVLIRHLLKGCWLRNDYTAFEARLAEADRRFSVGKLNGRDSERGLLFVKLGPPDEKEAISMTMWSCPFEVLHYYATNDFLFSDTENDHNPRLITVLKPGELTTLLKTGMRDGTRQEDWMSEMSNGTYDWKEDLQSPERRE